MSTEPHYHDCVELIYIRRGEVRVFFDSDWHTLSRGSLLFVPPGCIHRCVSCDDTAEQVVVGFADELICKEDSQRRQLFCPYRTGVVPTARIFSSDYREIGERMEALCSTEAVSEGSACLSFCANVLSVYGLIYGVWECEGLLSASRAESLLISEIRAYVSEHFSSRIKVDELLKRLNISYSYLSKLMSREMGMSFGRYMITCRVENAKKLLLSTEKSMAEIGYECGFASSSAFISHFRALTGKTPLMFRKEALKSSFDMPKML